MSKKKVLLCLTGASGAIYGLRALRLLKKMGHEVHLIISKWGEKTLEHELDMKAEALKKEADFSYEEDDLAAGPASGSFHIDSVLIAPCSMKTLAGIAQGYADNLVARASDCALKERRPLVLLVRETPLNLIHIRNMESVTQAGGIIFPASPAFWHKPENVDELVDGLLDRIFTHLKVKENTSVEWQGL